MNDLDLERVSQCITITTSASTVEKSRSSVFSAYLIFVEFWDTTRLFSPVEVHQKVYKFAT